MFKKGAKLLFILLLAALLAGSAAALAEDWPDLSGQKLQVTAVWTGPEQEYFEEVLARFTELTGAEVTYTGTRDLTTVLGTQIEGGNPPDIAMLPNPGLIREYGRRGVLVPIGEVVGETVDQYYAEVWRELGSVDGTLYGIWFKAANKSLMWYNTAIFEEAGVEPAATFAELLEVAETLYAYGITPFSLGGASSWTLTDWFENIYLRSAGPENYDKLVAHEIPWTDDTVKEAFTLLKEVFGRPEWLSGGVQGSLEANHPQGIIRPFLDEPQAAIAYGADFSATAISNETKAELGVDALFFDFPAINDSPKTVLGAGDAMVVFKNNEGSRALIKFLATPEAAEIRAARGGFTSPNKGVNLDVYPSEILRRSAQALQQAAWFRFDLSDLQPSEFGSTAGTGMRFWLQEFVRNPDVELTIQELEADAQQAFGE